MRPDRRLDAADPDEPGDARGPLGLAGALSLLALVVAARLFAIRAVPLYDDAFITYRYAENVAQGHGLVYEPGAAWEPVLGTTTPAYALGLVPWILLGVSAPTASLVTNVLCDLVSAALLLWALRSRPLAAALVVLGFACMPEIARISAGGMEAPALVAVALATAVAFESGRTRLAALGCVLAGALRPEAVLFAALLAIAAWRKGVARRFLPPLVLAGGAFVALLSVVYGSPIPQSVIAKAERHADGSALEAILSILRQACLPNLAYLPGLALVALGLPRLWRSPPALAHVARFGIAIVASYLVMQPHTAGWYYYLPLVAWVLALAVGAEALWLRFRGVRLARLEAAAPLGATALGLVALLVGSRGRVDRVTERVYRPLASWARSADPAASGARILASDIGAVGFYTGATILDTEGLVWPQAVESHGSQVEWIRAHAPEYLWITSTRAKLGVLLGDPVLADYEAVQRFSATGATDLAPAPDALSATWVQDYVLFRRTARARAPSTSAAPATSSESRGAR
jgi:hypothetical protein